MQALNTLLQRQPQAATDAVRPPRGQVAGMDLGHRWYAPGTHITIRGLDKRFGAHTLYDNFDLDIPRGKLISIFGPNGCGKSTLINMIAGILPYDRGQILFDGKDVHETRIGYVFQNYREAVFPWLRAIDNIDYPLKYLKLSKGEKDARIDKLVAKLRREDRPQPVPVRDVRRPAADGVHHACAGGRAGSAVPGRAVLRARL